MRWFALLFVVLTLAAPKQSPAADAAGRFASHEWTIGGVRRAGEIWVPGGPRPDTGWPVVFVFHGHGGNVAHAKRMYAIEQSWPQAVVVYLQGLPTPGALTDPDGRLTGWDMQNPAGSNKDVELFDAVLAELTHSGTIDPRRVYAAGHSNGGGFVYVLWATRGDKLAAVAPSASIAGKWTADLKPKPALMIGGRNDALVKWAWQERMMAKVRAVNACSAAGKPWNKDDTWDGTWYDSKQNTPAVTLTYNGGHAPPADIGWHTASFFQALEGGH